MNNRNLSPPRLWTCPEVTAFLSRHRHYVITMHYGQYTSRYLKPAALVTNLTPLQALGPSCSR
eukprot:2706651-Pyramimonas_sp.AAC.1